MKTKILIYFLLPVIGGILLTSCEKDESTDGTGKSVNLSRDLVLHITFDEGKTASTTQTVIDHSGKGNNGVIDGSPEFVSDIPGSTGYALKLRKGDYVNIPSFACSDSTNITVSMWVKDFGQGLLFTSLNGDRITTPTVYINSSDQILYQYNRTFGYDWSRSLFSTSITGFQNSGWHHLAFTSTRKLDTTKFYVDGRLMDTQSGSQEACSGTKMQIGGNADGAYSLQTDPMLIDNVRVYKRCLSDKEVKEIYNEEKN